MKKFLSVSVKTKGDSSSCFYLLIFSFFINLEGLYFMSFVYINANVSKCMVHNYNFVFIYIRS